MNNGFGRFGINSVLTGEYNRVNIIKGRQLPNTVVPNNRGNG
jgi:hypothetical protein